MNQLSVSGSSSPRREPLYEFDELATKLGKTHYELRMLISRHKLLPVFDSKPRKYRLSDFHRAVRADGDLTKPDGWPPAADAPFKVWVQALANEVKTLPIGGRIGIPDKNSSNLLHHVRLICQGMTLTSRIDQDDATKRWVYRTK